MILLSIMLISMLALSVACGGGDDDDSSGDDDSEATATESADDEEEDEGDDSDDDEETPEAADDEEDSGDGEGDSLGDLEDIAGEYQGADGVVTYTMTSDDGSGGTWVVYTEGDSSRVDLVDESGGFISITTPEASYTCTETDGEGMCFEGEGGLGVNPFAGLFTSFASYEAISNYIELFTDVDVEESSEEVAGVDASCFTAEGDFEGDAGTIKWCFSDDGALLLSSYDLESGLFEMEATDFSSDVPGDAFDPPYDVTDLGDFGQ